MLADGKLRWTIVRLGYTKVAASQFEGKHGFLLVTGLAA